MNLTEFCERCGIERRPTNEAWQGFDDDEKALKKGNTFKQKKALKKVLTKIKASGMLKG